MISMTTAFKNYWKNYFNFSGDATRAEYWWMVIWSFLFTIFWSAAGTAVAYHHTSAAKKLISATDYTRLNLPPAVMAWMGITVFVGLLLVIPSLSLEVRRLHNTGLASFWVWLLVLADLSTKIATEFVNSMPLTIATAVLSLIIFILILIPSNFFEYAHIIGRDR
ncbi:DUF805 domain-containing protein [Convivina praedatoris]|uniref:DUF805 domain-containing protein n=2 Tax=Convivina praedatoris TaxID=2880963 RepID=A0ABM9D2W1_9LACO|nr:DUF805 domain-containing protein [Convivina sp. LMG 32447]CAH1855445.1 hypothetical protein R077815_01219 [Convivina sp. LMG 32447]CAH1856102.1 hypothetical protein LMG032447_01228 [Convivina sp. LMG 32447]CAH1856483.1 hypothetical protein R078138_01372 [Convivina sp. LMG 32447]